MLMQKIRDWTAGWIAVVILGLIIITFAVWGVNFSDLSGERVVASVNGETIKFGQFQRAYSNYLRQVREETGKSVPVSEEASYKRRIVDALVQNEIINQAVEAQGLQISNTKVKDAIKALDVFGGEIGFDRFAYETVMARMGLTPEIFEGQLRRELIADQLQRAVQESTFVVDEEARLLARIDSQTRYLSYVIFPADAIKDTITIEDADVDEYYDGRQEGLMEAERVKLAYVELAVDKLIEGVEFVEEDLERYYDDHKDRYDEEERRKINIVNFQLAPDADNEAVAVAFAKAEKIESLIAGGVSFSEVAEKHDDGSEPEMLVTEHDYLARNEVPEAIVDAVFTSDEGELSEVIRADNGLYLFRVEEIRGGVKNTFEHFRADVERDYKRSYAEHRYFDLADKLVTLVYEHPDTLDVAAEEIGVGVEESEFFNRSNAEGIFANGQVLATVFDQEFIQSGHNSQAIEIDDMHLLVLRVLEHRSAEKKPLEAVRDLIVDRLKVEGAGERQRAKSGQVIAELKAGVSRAAVAETFGFDWTHAEAVERDDPSVNRQILRAAFRAAKPADGEETVLETTIGRDDRAVIVVTDVIYLDTPATQALERAKSTLLSSRTRDEWLATVEELKRKADTTINEESL